LHRVIERSVQVLGIQARYRGKLLKQLGVVPEVVGSEAQLSQVFINLLLNAVQALPEGRPDLNEVTIACFTGPSGEAVVEVRDSGHGIAAEVLPRIFDPFFTTKPPGVGTGLGLSVIFNIVTTLGGRVEVKSTVGVGSTFRVVLPAAQTSRATLSTSHDP
jgi:signal transduction histidine kinase